VKDEVGLKFLTQHLGWNNPAFFRLYDHVEVEWVVINDQESLEKYEWDLKCVCVRLVITQKKRDQGCVLDNKLYIP